ncbi:hypothetical protein [Phytohabitans kaempferiae]|uniref:MucB/RseB N-terminal domain-containing protein n=1 Tax=Phytohabitans kaempferiae TaxID=1620943 RepID=A0ABV6M283_9ACTN
MDDIEHLVRVTLTDRAAGVGPTTDLVRRAHGRARRERRRARAVGVAVAAAAVLMAVPVTSRVWTPGQPSTVEAADTGPLSLTPFPFVPTVSLPGYGEPVAEISAGLPWLRHAGAGERTLTVTVNALAPPRLEWAPAVKAYSVVVHERTARLEAGRTGTALTWQEPDGRWLRVEADRHLAHESLVRYAEGLAPGAVPVRRPFDFAVLPPGTVPDIVGATAVSFRPERSRPSHDFAGKLTVLLSYTDEVSPAGRPVAVGGRPGRLADGAAASVLSVDLGDGRTLVVQAAPAVGLSEADLLAFAAGVRPTPHAEVGRG